MQYVIPAVKSRKTALLRLTKAKRLIREFRQLISEQLLTVLMFGSVISNCTQNKHQQLDLLAIASAEIILNHRYTLQIIPEHGQNLYQQFFAAMEQTQ